MQKKFTSSQTIKGEVLAVGEARTIGTFELRELVIKSGTAEYPKGIPIEFTRGDVSLLDGVNPGDTAEVEYFIEGSAPKDTGRFYVHLRGRQIEVSSRAAAPAASGGATMADAVAAWTAKNGGDKSGFAKFCTDLKPDVVALAKKAGMKFTDFVNAHKPEVWGEIVAAINDTPLTDDADDLPF